MKHQLMTGYILMLVAGTIWLIYSVQSGWWPQSDWLTLPLMVLVFLGGFSMSKIRIIR